MLGFVFQVVQFAGRLVLVVLVVGALGAIVGTVALASGGQWAGAVFTGLAALGCLAGAVALVRSGWLSAD